jgi:hypothetical protein
VERRTGARLVQTALAGETVLTEEAGLAEEGGLAGEAGPGEGARLESVRGISAAADKLLQTRR